MKRIGRNMAGGDNSRTRPLGLQLTAPELQEDWEAEERIGVDHGSGEVLKQRELGGMTHGRGE